MDSALYYPFTRSNSHEFFKTALFLWDKVDFIVPWRGHTPHGLTKEETEALEIIGQSYVPTVQDKKNAHKEFEGICKMDLHPALKFDLEKSTVPYDFYPQKLLPETWNMLKTSGLASIIGGPGDVQRASTSPLFGYYMMSVLAVCCANGRKRMVTDEHDPYRALASIMSDSPETKTSAHADWHGRLIAVTLAGPDFSRNKLSTLIKLRKNEDQLLREMRVLFLKEVDAAAADITANAANENIVRERIQDFSNKMEQDLKEVKRALRRSAGVLLLSKYFGVSVLAFLAGNAILPGVGNVLGAMGLSKDLIEYRDRRRKLLREHPSSWLLAASGPRMPLW